MKLIHLLRICSVIAVSGLFACSQATEEQCDKAFDRYFELKEQGLPAIIRKVNAAEFEGKRPSFLSKCVGRIEPSVIKCWLSAESLERLHGCQVDTRILR